MTNGCLLWHYQWYGTFDLQEWDYYYVYYKKWFIVFQMKVNSFNGNISIKSWPDQSNLSDLVEIQFRDLIIKIPLTVYCLNICFGFAGARVLSAETVAIQLCGGMQHGNHHITYTRTHGENDKIWLYVIRLYLDGEYHDPSPIPEQTLRTNDCLIQ